MEIPVLVKPLPEGGFQARSADALGFTAQGDTPTPPCATCAN